MYLLVIVVLLLPAMGQCDITNLGEFFSALKQNKSGVYPLGYLTQANFDVVKRYLPGNIEARLFQDKQHMLDAINNGTITAGIATSQLAQDLEPQYHVFSSLIISPQAMLVAPDYNPVSTPYGLRNTSSNDLFDALNAAIAGVQEDGADETSITRNNLTDLVRVYTCRQDTQLPVANRNETTGFLRDILYSTSKLLIGGLGPYDWGAHDGNYKEASPKGFYPELLDNIVQRFGKLKGPDGIIYGEKITSQRIYFPNATALFQALLNGSIHATDVYILIDAPYDGTGEACVNNTTCRPRESCVAGVCTHPTRPRSLHFRTTCTTASRDTKFITKKADGTIKTPSDSPRETPKTRYIGFILLFVALFGTIFLALVILIRRKKHYRIEHTLTGGLGKFARLQEESEPPMDGMDAFDDHIVQSPRDNANLAS